MSADVGDGELRVVALAREGGQVHDGDVGLGPGRAGPVEHLAVHALAEHIHRVGHLQQPRAAPRAATCRGRARAAHRARRASAPCAARPRNAGPRRGCTGGSGCGRRASCAPLPLSSPPVIISRAVISSSPSTSRCSSAFRCDSLPALRRGPRPARRHPASAPGWACPPADGRRRTARGSRRAGRELDAMHLQVQPRGEVAEQAEAVAGPTMNRRGR